MIFSHQLYISRLLVWQILLSTSLSVEKNHAHTHKEKKYLQFQYSRFIGQMCILGIVMPPPLSTRLSYFSPIPLILFPLSQFPYLINTFKNCDKIYRLHIQCCRTEFVLQDRTERHAFESRLLCCCW